MEEVSRECEFHSTSNNITDRGMHNLLYSLLNIHQDVCGLEWMLLQMDKSTCMVALLSGW